MHKRGEIMDDPNFFKWLFGVFLGIWFFITKWTHTRTTSAHMKIDSERKDNEQRFNDVYHNIKISDNKTETCRKEIEKDIHALMTESQVKDFVDRSLKPLTDKVDDIHDDVKTLLLREK